MPCYQTFIEGVEEGLKTVVSILPALVAILSAAAMLRQSGAISAICDLLSPVTDFFGFPSEVLPLAIIRPLSGGGSIGLLTDTVKTYGADSTIARMACIMCASTETTFYTIMVYFRKTKVKYTKRVILAAVFGDLVGILCAFCLSKINF
ncbi:MAG: spore maturation protein [Clostridia bacterium]|nr:spore maturation protein [Clostridia bacterium]